ncbi:MAG: YihY/virulence factor BrkB family protein [Candidatus Latescibacterota bacterium]
MGDGTMERLASAYPLRVRGVSLSLLAARSAQRFLEVRVMGLAAEMAYYALLSAFPLTAAIGTGLGLLEGIVGTEAARRAGAAIVRGLQAVFGPEATADVIAPLVQALLHQERAGLTLGGCAVSLFFGSRLFRSVIETLDVAYRVQERRGTVSLWLLGLLLALGAVVVTTTILGMVVVGPLLGGARNIAGWLGLGTAFEVAWTAARWPFVFAVATAFLALLYRVGPNVRNTWTESLPGAALGMVALVLVAVGLRVYVEATGLHSPQIEDADDAVRVALQVIGALLAMLLWGWLSSMAVLTGGVVNAELGRLRREGRLPAP